MQSRFQVFLKFLTNVFFLLYISTIFAIKRPVLWLQTQKSVKSSAKQTASDALRFRCLENVANNPTVSDDQFLKAILQTEHPKE